MADKPIDNPNDSIKQDLLPCPFCGGEAAHGSVKYSKPLENIKWADDADVTEAFSVNCTFCGVNNRTFAGGYRSPSEAAENWNTRQSLPKGGE